MNARRVERLFHPRRKWRRAQLAGRAWCHAYVEIRRSGGRYTLLRCVRTAHNGPHRGKGTLDGPDGGAAIVEWTGPGAFIDRLRSVLAAPNAPEAMRRVTSLGLE